MLILASSKTENENKTELPKSDFNLKTDLTDFKKKMTDLDTIIVLFDHSACDYEGYEEIEITKLSDSIKVKSKFQDLNNDLKWSLVYEKKMSKNDTIWDFENFIKRNGKRKLKDLNNREILTAINKKDTIRFYVNNLGDLNHFLEDYFLTMRKLYPENKNGIYGFDNSEIKNKIDAEIKETE